MSNVYTHFYIISLDGISIWHALLVASNCSLIFKSIIALWNGQIFKIILTQNFEVFKSIIISWFCLFSFSFLTQSFFFLSINNANTPYYFVFIVTSLSCQNYTNKNPFAAKKYRPSIRWLTFLVWQFEFNFTTKMSPSDLDLMV